METVRKIDNMFCSNSKFAKSEISGDVPPSNPISESLRSRLNCDIEASADYHNNLENVNILENYDEEASANYYRNDQEPDSWGQLLLEEKGVENSGNASSEVNEKHSKKPNHLNHVDVSDCEVYCHLCNKELPSAKSIDEHVGGNKHQKAVVALQAFLRTAKPKEALLSGDNSALAENSEVCSEIDSSQRSSTGDMACGGGMKDQMDEQYTFDKVSEEKDTELQGTMFQNIKNFGRNIFHCTVCQASLIGYTSVEQHVIGKKHTKNLSVSAVNIELLWNKVRELEHGKKKNIHMISLNNFRCTLCSESLDVAAVISHVQGKDHQQKLKELVNKRKDVTEKHTEAPLDIQTIWKEIYKAEGGRMPNICLNSDGIFHCRPCDVQLMINDVLKHVKEESHQAALLVPKVKESNESVIRISNDIWKDLHAAQRTHETYFKPDTGKTMYCTCCRATVVALAQNVGDHIRGRNHMNNIVKIVMSRQSQNRDQSEKKKSETQVTTHPKHAQEALINALMLKKKADLVETEEQFGFHCLVCDFEVESLEFWHQHINSTNHKTKVATLINEGNDLVSYKCEHCNTVLCTFNKDSHECRNKPTATTSRNTQQAAPSQKRKQKKKKTEQPDSVPRIVVYGFEKGVGMETLYSFFKDFGTISFVGVTSDEAVIEFIESDAVKKTEKATLTLGGARLTVKSLTHFNHHVPEQPVSVDESIIAVFASVQNFEKELKALCEMTNSVANPGQSKKVCHFLETKFSALFPGSTALPFGSRISGLAFPDSDMDIFLDTGGMYEGRQRQEASVQEVIVSMVTAALEELPECDKVEAVPKARTPIVRFYHKPSRMQCDVAFRHGLGCENTKLIRFYMSLDARVKQLIVFLKHWANVHKLIGPHSITNYALTWLVIFYLQQASGFGLPPVESLMKLHNGRKKTIAGWDCSFCKDKSLLPPITSQQTIRQLLRGFFKHYQNFGFSKLVVCPLIGIPISKDMFTKNIDSLPQSMDNYIYHVRRSKHSERFRTQCCMYVQDPFDLSHNITKGTLPSILRKFKVLCGLTADLCDKL